MGHRADSVTKIIDSLISSQRLVEIVFESTPDKETSISYRRYFVDTANHFLVKCILDTTFTDYYNRTLQQTVIYFHQGYEFKNCYNARRNVVSDMCSIFNIYPEGYEVAEQRGKLDTNWKKENLDEKMRHYVASDIDRVKFLQKKNSENRY